jgi:hypothetical protein
VVCSFFLFGYAAYARTHRRTHNVPDKDHFEILQEFGWTEDEYDDGERVELACPFY